MDLEREKYFKINSANKPRFWVVDDFYEDPIAIRNYALEQWFFDDEGYVGMRTRTQHFFPGVKEKFEEIMGMKITEWESYGMNGRFQSTVAGLPLAVHCDDQQWAGMIYLTPDAPFESGTTAWAHKKSRIRHGSDAEDITQVFNQKTFVDLTPYEPVDVIGNVFNRLVIFDGRLVHSASQYFGWDIGSGRLWHMFFFDAK